MGIPVTARHLDTLADVRMAAEALLDGIREIRSLVGPDRNDTVNLGMRTANSGLTSRISRQTGRVAVSMSPK